MAAIIPSNPYASLGPTPFNLDTLPTGPSNAQQLRPTGLHNLAPGSTPGQVYTFSGNAVPPRSGVGGVAGQSSGTTNYFLNGMPIDPSNLDAALKALQTPTTTTPGPQFDPAAGFNQQTPGSLPGLNTSGVNPYLNDPIMANYYGMQNPLYGGGGQQDFYGDPELFNAPSVGRATGG